MLKQILKVEAQQENVRLDVFLTQTLSDIPSRTFVKKLIETGHVLVNHSLAKAHYKTETGDEIEVEIPEEFLKPDHIEPENIPLDIFYEDDYLLVVNKPVGMLVHPAQGFYTATLVNALLYHCKQLSDVNADFRPGIVHRLDQDTSGLILIAKDNQTHLQLAEQFKNHTIKKKYLALVQGEIEFDEGMIDAPLGRHSTYREKRDVQFNDSAKEAVTYYRVIKRSPSVTFVALFPQTGRTHQLRVHMAYLKHPILGDAKYGKKETFPRLALHAQSIGFIHPRQNCFLEFSSQTPSDFLAKIQGDKKLYPKL